MGKQKHHKRNTKEPVATEPLRAQKKEGKKTYSLQNVGPTQKEQDKGAKITLPRDLEQRIVDLIQDHHQQKMTKDKVHSKRLTSKKCMDMYNSLQQAGFHHTQIEQAMTNTVMYGGDLIDALDWLCLNLANDQLPDGFSETLEKEENKIRPKFDKTKFQSTATCFPDEQTARLPVTSATAQVLAAKQADQKSEKEEKMKNWILQYAEQSSDEDVPSNWDDDDNVDTNERYIELTALLLDAKEEASQAKREGDKVKQKQASQKVRDCITEMDRLEKESDFNPAVKIKNLDQEKRPVTNEVSNTCDNITTHETSPDKSHDMLHGTLHATSKNLDNAEEEEGDLGFALFDNTETSKEAEAKADTIYVKEEVRQFEYTRQQWTGKSPKQFLIDWCRKHKCEAPKFAKISAGGNRWKARAKIDRKKDGILEVVPDILCENVKEAEHLASTLALYHLCKGQSVQQLLPPPYRAVWVEWLDIEKTEADAEKETENKPRDQFISKLMKKLQVSEKETKSQDCCDDDGIAESWEDLDYMIFSSTCRRPEEFMSCHIVRRPASVNNSYYSYSSLSETEAAPEGQSPEVKVRKKVGGMPGQEMLKIFKERCQSDEYQSLLKSRQRLPVYQQREAILNKIDSESVVVIAGETGSGKSTQIPQFIMEHYLEQGKGSQCNIVCTEPRRISTTSLARRVSTEMGELGPGHHNAFCGYQIRFESRCGPNTHLVYCTTGVLLRRLQSDPTLQDISHVIVDEVHERSVQSDFLLIILRRLLKQRPNLKVILMSATLDSDKFSAYFHGCSVLKIPGRTFPVQVYHVEDVVEKTTYVLDDDSPYALRPEQLVREEQTSISVTEKGGEQTKVDVYWTRDNISKIDWTTLSADDYCLRTRNTVTRMNTDRINMELIVELLCYLEKSEEFGDIEGAVLIFMPGLADIQELYEVLLADRRFMDMQKYQVIALHSILSSADQSEAFRVPPPGVRKVVIATNIAETGITIPDVVFVIDTGRVKENRYMESSQMSALREVFISRANAKQRQGRAGRVRNGYCFRMYTQQKYHDMPSYTVPEIQRVPLEELCLHIMKCELGEPESFLAEGIDPPRSQVITRAMSMLHEVGACTGGDKLTPLGHHLAALPVHVRIGKMLLFGAIFGYLEPVAVIAAAMTTKSPFTAPIQKLDQAQAAKISMATACSDHLTVYRAFVGWKQAQKEGGHIEQQFCQKYFLRRNTLLEIENLSNDLIRLVTSIGFTNENLTRNPSQPQVGDVLCISKTISNSQSDVDSNTVAMVKAAIASGLYPNVAKVTYETPVDAAANPTRHVCIAETAQGPAKVHPSSINRNLAVSGWLAYQEKVTTSKVYLREVTLVSPLSLLLFGGEIHVQHIQQVVTIDDRISFKTYAKTGVMFRELRQLVDDLLQRKLLEPSLNLKGDKLIGLICEILCSENVARR